MNPYIFLAIIAVCQITRGGILFIEKKGTNFLWISFFILCVPFEFGRLFGGDSLTTATGTLGPAYMITVPLLLCFFVIFKSKFNSLLSFKFNNWVTIILGLIIISIINPYNEDYSASVVFAIYFISNIFLFKLLASFIDTSELIKGIYDGFLILCIVQFALAICFPLLGVTEVTELFHEGGAAEATRQGTRDGAIGLFRHPGALSLFIVIASSFFISTFLYNYNKKLSFLIIILNIITIVLTFSRTSYLAFIILLFLLIFIKKNGSKNLFSLSNIFKFVLPISLAVGWLVFLSPVGEIFLKSDSETQYENRTTHYKIAYHIFKASPIVGVGLNSHLTYIAKHPIVLSSVANDSGQKLEFFRENPIHNIHLILLAETGLLGFTLWVIFIFRNIYLSTVQIKKKQNQILSSTFIGVLVSVCFYGMTGWSPFSVGILPFFLLISFFSIKYQTA